MFFSSVFLCNPSDYDAQDQAQASHGLGPEPRVLQQETQVHQEEPGHRAAPPRLVWRWVHPWIRSALASIQPELTFAIYRIDIYIKQQ